MSLRPRVLTSEDIDRNRTRYVGSRDLSPRGEEFREAYLAKVTKYVPGEIIALHQLILAMPASLESFKPGLIMGLIVLSPLWFAVSTKDRGEPVAWHQVLLSSGAVLLWLFAIESPVMISETLGPYLGRFADANRDNFNEVGSALFGIYTFVTPMLERIFVEARLLLFGRKAVTP
jgi:hypothetical protein